MKEAFYYAGKDELFMDELEVVLDAFLEANYIRYRILNKYGLDVSGGERSEFNLLNELDKFNDDNILFYYIDPNELDVKTVIDILNGKKINYDNRFYENKTVFKVGDLK